MTRTRTTASKNAQFDRSEWLRKTKAAVDTAKVVEVTLRQGGATEAEVKSYLGGGYATQAGENGKLRIAKVQKPS
jgi:hypothetical protein